MPWGRPGGWLRSSIRVFSLAAVSVLQNGAWKSQVLLLSCLWFFSPVFCFVPLAASKSQRLNTLLGGPTFWRLWAALEEEELSWATREIHKH